MKRLVPCLLLAACGGAGSDADPPDAGEPPSRVYGGDRPVELQIPEPFDAAAQYPLVMLLHGYSASGFVQTAYLQLADVPAWGAFFLAPDGTVDASGNRFWAASDACCGEGAPPVDDVAYLGGLLDEIVADWPVDPAQVYLIGHSNGHFMSYRMACERADRVTAIAGLAGAATSVDGADCDPVQPVSSLHVHGDADTVVLYDGGVFGTTAYPGAIASTLQWAGHDGCADTLSAGAPLDLVRDLEGAETRVQIVDGCPAGLGVELWTIEDGGHVPSFHDTIGRTLVDWLTAHPR